MRKAYGEIERNLGSLVFDVGEETRLFVRAELVCEGGRRHQRR